MIRETSKLLVRSLKYEESYFAILFYKSYLKKFDMETFADITIWFETGINNWAHSDSICGELIFPLLKKNIIPYISLRPWIKAQNKFQRRAVPVSLIKTLKSTNDFQPLFSLIEPLMTDPEREVHRESDGFFVKPGKREGTN